MKVLKYKQYKQSLLCSIFVVTNIALKHAMFLRQWCYVPDWFFSFLHLKTPEDSFKKKLKIRNFLIYVNQLNKVLDDGKRNWLLLLSDMAPDRLGTV